MSTLAPSPTTTTTTTTASSSTTSRDSTSSSNSSDHVVQSTRNDKMSSAHSVKDLLGAWEKRSSLSKDDNQRHFINNTSSMFNEPTIKIKKKKKDASDSTTTRSTKQHLENLAVFASPREIKKKFIVPSTKLSAGKRNTSRNSWIKNDDEPLPVILNASTTDKVTKSDTPPTVAKDSLPQPQQQQHQKQQPHEEENAVIVPPVSSIRDRMKTFERNHYQDQNQGASSSSPSSSSWMTQMQRGKRGSVLDAFTPSQKPKPPVANDVLATSLAPFDEITKEEAVESTPQDIEPDLNPEDLEGKKAEVDKPTPVGSQSEKIDRDTLVLNEINKMIETVEEFEIEDEMDEEVKNCLVKAALQSQAYKRRWYDVMGDSWIHCPSLSTLIMDFTVIELAEELYEEELPMLYSVSLRAVAADILKDEVELPEYVYRLASEEDP